LLFSFKFSHFLNLRAYKNDHIIFNVGTSSLEARNIRFVNSNSSRFQESKLIPASWPQNIIRFSYTPGTSNISRLSFIFISFNWLNSKSHFQFPAIKMHAVIKIILDMQISKRNVISMDGKFWTLDEIFQWKKNLPLFPHFLCCHLEQISHSTTSWRGLTGAWHYIQLLSLILVMKHGTNEWHFITRICLDRTHLSLYVAH
jgi:hypothetical protein